MLFHLQSMLVAQCSEALARAFLHRAASNQIAYAMISQELDVHLEPVVVPILGTTSVFAGIATGALVDPADNCRPDVIGLQN